MAKDIVKVEGAGQEVQENPGKEATKEVVAIGKKSGDTPDKIERIEEINAEEVCEPEVKKTGSSTCSGFEKLSSVKEEVKNGEAQEEEPDTNPKDVSICTAFNNLSLANDGKKKKEVVIQENKEVMKDGVRSEATSVEKGENSEDGTADEACTEKDKETLIRTVEKQQDEAAKESQREHEEDDGSEEKEANEEGIPKPTQLGELAAETLICEERAKLYRFDDPTKSWKERGIGNIILVQSLENPDSCRVVMWVDGNGRIACNFRLFPEFTTSLLQGNPKVAYWKALDLSDQTEPKWEAFACRFRSAEKCTAFTSKMKEYATEAPSYLSLRSDESETTPALEKVVESNASCPGCIGCNSDTFQFPENTSEPKIEAIIDIQLASDSCTDEPITVKPADFFLI